MPRPRYRRSTRSRAPRRDTAWAQIGLSEQQTAANGQVIQDVLTGLSVAEKRAVHSVLRVILDFGWSATGANFAVNARIGLVVVHDDALAAGAVPDPFGDEAAGWMLNQWVSVDGAASADFRHITRDLRAGRVLPGEFSTLAFVLDAASSNDSSMNWSLGLRVLYSKT